MTIQSHPSGASALSSGFKSGSEIIFETLRALGVKIIFGYPGASVQPLFDALYRLSPDSAGFVHHLRPAALQGHSTEEPIHLIGTNLYRTRRVL
jgi:acetolactate synthase-1/2/3 large subunit